MVVVLLCCLLQTCLEFVAVLSAVTGEIHDLILASVLEKYTS